MSATELTPQGTDNNLVKAFSDESKKARAAYSSRASSDFYGAFERQGSYIISVYKEGYAEYTSDVIEVGADRCHVITEEVIVELQPE